MLGVSQKKSQKYLSFDSQHYLKFAQSTGFFSNLTERKYYHSVSEISEQKVWAN